MSQNEVQAQINKLKYAITSNDSRVLASTLEETSAKYPMTKIIELESATQNTSVRYIEVVYSPYNDLVVLAQKYISILEIDLQSANWSSTAVNMLFNSNAYFRKDDILYKKNDSILTVGTILKVIGYAKKVLDISGVKMSKNLNAGADLTLIALNTIDFALNNKKQDKPLNKILNLANDALSTVFNVAVEDERLGKYVEVSSLAISSTIDFLVRE